MKIQKIGCIDTKRERENVQRERVRKANERITAKRQRCSENHIRSQYSILLREEIQTHHKAKANEWDRRYETHRCSILVAIKAHNIQYNESTCSRIYGML